MNPPTGTAAELYRDLHWGIAAKRTRHHRTPNIGPALAELGELTSIEYSTEKEGDGPSTYVHTFGEEGGRRPSLAVDPQTRDLVIIGGDYTVESHGIID